MDIPDEMTAAVLHAAGDLRVERVPVPWPGPKDVLIRVGACGICGSDVPRVMTKGTYSFPLIPGHEFAGTIVRKGPRVKRFELGQRVTVFPLLPCGECHWCKRDAYQLCDNYDYLGSRSNGAFAEYVTAPQRNLVRVPDAVPLECAAMTEPATVARHALKRTRHKLETVAIFGSGPIGVIAAQWVTFGEFGAERAWLVDIREDKLDVARKLTEAECINASQTDPVARIREATGGLGVDLALEAAGVPMTARQCIEVATKQGDVIFMGNPSADVTIPQDEFSQILRKELHLHGTWNSWFVGGRRDDWGAVLMSMALADLDGLNVEPLITHRYRIEQANEAFAMMAENREFYNKVMFVFD
jgi:L-iditol 2-dehydrogenase